MLMEKLSLLVFSRNDIDKAIDLISDMYQFSDEIVLIDSSDEPKRRALLRWKQRKRLYKLRIIHAIALGYPDPLRMYALKQCSNDWILLVDTDERISRRLKDRLKSVISAASYPAFAIKRYEQVRGEHLGEFYTWQIRLFRKSRVLFRGYIHEQPLVKGTIGKLEDGYYMKHIEGLRTPSHYGRMEMFDRLSYAQFNERMMELLAKGLVKRKEEAERTALGRVLRAMLLLYQKMGLKDPDSEIGTIDYLTMYLLMDMGYMRMEHNLSRDRIFGTIRTRIRQVRGISAEKRTEAGREIFEIAKKINNVGIIKYLGLDDPRIVARLNERYRGKPQGIDLFIGLLKEKYRNERGK
jgi:hypothetical protein